MRTIPLPPPVQKALERLRAAGHEAYIVGGCVRDAYRGVPPDDWDIATSATPDAVKAAFPRARVIETGIRHGTVTVILDAMPLEITTYRVDGTYTDHRRPDTVHYTQNLRDDLARRDFTMNAIAYAPGEWVDPFGGCDDIDGALIRCVGDARQRFTEDALRIMRGLRFRATLDFAIHADTHDALIAKRDTLRAVAVERLTKELCRMLLGPAIAKVLLDDRIVLCVIVPEFEGITAQRWEIMARALPNAPLSLPIRLAILFRLCEDPGRGLRRLRLDRDTLTRAEALIALHDMPLPADAPALSRALYRHGAQTLLDLLDMREAFPSRADGVRGCAGGGVDGAQGVICGEGNAVAAGAQSAPCVHPARALVESLIADDAFTIAALPLRGQDLMALGYRGPAIGAALEALLFAVFDGKVAREREALLAYVGRGEDGAYE